jgi:hypothetical protein
MRMGGAGFVQVTAWGGNSNGISGPPEWCSWCAAALAIPSKESNGVGGGPVPGEAIGTGWWSLADRLDSGAMQQQPVGERRGGRRREGETMLRAGGGYKHGFSFG